MSAGVDIASLGVDIDSSSAETASVRFQDLVRVSQSLEQMFGQVDRAVRTTSTTIGQASAGAAAASAGLRQYGESARGAAAPMDGLVASARRAYDGFLNLIDKVDGARQSLQGLTSIRLDNLSGATQQTARVSEMAESYRELAGSVEQAITAQRRADALRPAGGGGGGNPPVPPGGGGGGGSGSGPGGGGGAPNPQNTQLIDRMIRDIETRIGRLNIDSPREGEQYVAARRAGADDLRSLTEPQEQLTNLVGVLHDLAEASRQAQQAEQARVAQAGSQYQQRLNESFGISRPAGDSAPRSARDSARVFEAAGKEEDAYQAQLAKVAAAADPVGTKLKALAADVLLLDQALAKGDISLEQHAQYLGQIKEKQDKLNGSDDWAKQAAADADTYAKSLQNLLAKIDPVGTALANYAKQVALIEAATEKGDLTPKQRTAALEGAQSDLNDQSGATAAANSFDRYTARAEALRASLDPATKSQQEFNKAVAEARDLLDNNVITVADYDTAVIKAKERQDSFNATLDKGAKQAGLTGQQYFWLLSNVKDFFNQVYAGGSPTTAAMQQFPMMAQILAMGEGGIKGSIQGIGNLAKRQFMPGQAAEPADAGSMPSPAAVSGMRPDTPMMNQILSKALTTPGGSVPTAGATRELGAFSSALENFTIPARLAVGAIGGVTAAITTLYLLGKARMDAIEKSTFGVGARTGLSVDAINNTALASTNAVGGVSRASAREGAVELARAGTIAPGAFQAANSILKDYASTTDQDMIPAAKDLAAALGAGAAGADQLNAKLGFLNSSTRETYVQMLAAGDKTGAQNLLIKALIPTLDDATARLSIFARTWNLVKAGVSNAIDIAATGIDRVVTGGTLEEQLEKAKADVAELKRTTIEEGPASADDILYNSGGQAQKLRDAERRQEDLQKRIDAASGRGQVARQAQYSLDVDSVTKQLNPLDEQIKKLTADLRLLQNPEFKWSLPADKIRETELATAALSRQLRQVAEDAKYGGAQFLEMVTSAKNASELINATPLGRQLSDIRTSTEQQKRDLDRQGVNSNITVRTTESAGLQNLVASGGLNDIEKAAAQKRIETLNVEIDGYKKQIESLDTSASIRSQTAIDTARNQTVTQGGAYSQAPAQVQGYIDKAVAQYASKGVTTEILSGLIKTESSFKDGQYGKNKDGTYTTAYGYTQLTDAAATDVGKRIPGFNKMDPEKNVMGGADYLADMLKQFNNDVFTALAAFHDGAGATRAALRNTGQVLPAGREYAETVMRASGTRGGQSQQDIAQRLDQQARDVATKQSEVALDAKYGGVNQYQIDKARESERLYNEEKVRSGTVSDAAAANIAKVSAQLAALNQEASQTKLGKDMTFQLEQMGRSSLEAPGYAQLRSAGIPADSAQGQALLSQSRYLEGMQQLKGVATDVWGSISQGIMSGAKASDIALSAISKIESKLLDMAGNTIIASLFEGITGTPQSGGASSGLNLGSLFGGGGKGFGGGPSNGGFIDGIKSLFGGGSDNFAGHAASEVGPFLPGAGSSGGGIFDTIKSFFGFANGGIMTPLGPLPLTKYASGGVASSPQVAVFGEGAHNEAYVPLPDGRTIPVTLDGRAGGSAAQSFAPSFTASITMSGSSGNAQADSQHAEETARTMRATFQDMFNEHVANESRPGGSMYRSGSDRSGY